MFNFEFYPHINQVFFNLTDSKYEGYLNDYNDECKLPQIFNFTQRIKCHYLKPTLRLTQMAGIKNSNIHILFDTLHLDKSDDLTSILPHVIFR